MSRRGLTKEERKKRGGGGGLIESEGGVWENEAWYFGGERGERREGAWVLGWSEMWLDREQKIRERAEKEEQKEKSKGKGWWGFWGLCGRDWVFGRRLGGEWWNLSVSFRLDIGTCGKRSMDDWGMVGGEQSREGVSGNGSAIYILCCWDSAEEDDRRKSNEWSDVEMLSQLHTIIPPLFFSLHPPTLTPIPSSSLLSSSTTATIPS